MALNVFPTSPLPAGLQREFDWAENVTKYDSGARQAVTPYVRPLYKWSVPWQNINDVKQSGLSSFFNLQKGMTTPFLMKDPIDFRVNCIFLTSGNVTEPVSTNLFDLNSFFIRADTTTIGSITSNKSGFVTLGSEYDYDQDTGLLTINSIDTDDYWTVESLQYFRKCAFEGPYRETGIIWNQFSVRLQIEEIV